MSFKEILDTLDTERIRQHIAACSLADVERSLARPRLSFDEWLALLSPAAVSHLEPLTQRSARVTTMRFGRTIQFYAPLYLSNECVNRCSYCGFAINLTIPRRTLSTEEAVEEALVLHRAGFRHVLLVGGESPRHITTAYLTALLDRIGGMFDSISVELQPMDAAGYRELAACGVDGMALYQETYDQVRYREVHPAGPKRNYADRLAAIERAGEAGFRTLGIGVLLGLSDWRTDAALLALHAGYLSRRFWRSRIAISFPRLRETPADFTPPHPVSDAELIQMVAAMRVLFPDADLVLSTREAPSLRDRMIGMGITRISAGSRTVPGGYTHVRKEGGQFEVHDDRSPAEVASAIVRGGYEPVWKDFAKEFKMCKAPQPR